MKKRLPRSLLIVGAVVVIAAVIGVFWLRRTDGPDPLHLGDFENRVRSGQVAEATINDRSNNVTGKLADGTRFEVSYPGDYAPQLTRILLDNGVNAETNPQHEPLWMNLLYQLLPVVLLVGVFLFVMTSMQGGGSRMLGFGRNKPRQLPKDHPKVKFADVAGCEEAVEDLKEIRDFLEDPGKFHALGATIPKGVLLYGPPGTGKTLLARAVAGEAGVPFFSMSGSDFVEMFAGVGASRVRDLFQQARQSAPAIVFVDEIDAVGRQRATKVSGGSDEQEQTLNQLLVEMDGFDVDSGVLLMAATNRPDILDPALLRPGRFDRQIVVDQPDLEGRKAILEVHTRGKPLADDVNLATVARRTPGFTGADLSNTINEAAILAARRGDALINMGEVEEAIDRVMAGPERKSRVMSDREKLVIAYHEAGHALVGHVLPNTDQIHKVSIIARGRALGWTLSLPTEDKNIKTRSELRDEMAMLMGGRTAEELIFGDPTTGAANDLERATQIARAMVLQFGMSDALGPQQFGWRAAEHAFDREPGHDVGHSDELAGQVDAEVRGLLDHAHAEAREILTLHRVTLDRLAEALVEHETLSEHELAQIFADAPTSSTTHDDPPADAEATTPDGLDTGIPRSGEA